MIRLLLRLFVYLCAAYGVLVVMGEIGLVTASPPSVEEIVERLIRVLIADVF